MAFVVYAKRGRMGGSYSSWRTVSVVPGGAAVASGKTPRFLVFFSVCFRSFFWVEFSVTTPAHLRCFSNHDSSKHSSNQNGLWLSLGNSGNSDAPHLHFQLMDSSSPLGAEGIPYELETFTQLGVVTVPDSLDTGQPWKPDSENGPVVRKHEFPIDYAVVTFP